MTIASDDDSETKINSMRWLADFFRFRIRVLVVGGSGLASTKNVFACGLSTNH